MDVTSEPTLLDYDQHAKAWVGSGESQRRYCQRLGLSYRRFKLARHRWLHRTAKTQVPSDFMPVEITGLKPTLADKADDCLTLQWQSGTVTVSGTLSVTGLSSLLAILTQHVC